MLSYLQDAKVQLVGFQSIHMCNYSSFLQGSFPISSAIGKAQVCQHVQPNQLVLYMLQKSCAKIESNLLEMENIPFIPLLALFNCKQTYLDGRQMKALCTQTVSVVNENTFYKVYVFSGEPKEFPSKIKFLMLVIGEGWKV